VPRGQRDASLPGVHKLDTGGAGLDEVIDFLRDFLMPAAQAIVAGGLLDMAWPASGPWRR